MVSKINRFHGRRSINNVYKYGNSVNLSQINLRFLSTPKDPKVKIAVVVSKKVCKSAVQRNRIRRRIYETIRKNLDNIKPSSRLIFNVYSDIYIKLEQEKLSETITKLLQKADLSSK